MKKQNIDSIKTMGLKSLEIIHDVVTEIQSEIGLTGNNNIIFKLHEFSYNYEARKKGLNWLTEIGATKKSEKIADRDVTLGYQLIADKVKISQAVTLIKERMLVLAKELAYGGIESSKESMTMSYNINTRTFRIAEITFILAENKNQAELCRVILKDNQSINKTWNWDEILEEWGWPENRIYEKPTRTRQLKIHNAAELFNTRIGKESKQQISDFFISNMKTTRVNPKYLPKS